MPDKKPRPMVFDLKSLAKNVASSGRLSGGVQPSIGDIQSLMPVDPRNSPVRPVSEEVMEGIRSSAGFREALQEAQQALAREKRERHERENATLATLEGIQDQLSELSRVIVAHDTLIKAHADELVAIRTGASGRPSAMHLVRAEFERRVALGQLEGTVTAQSEVLASWLPSAHPGAAPAKAKSIRNNLGARYREAKAQVRSAPVSSVVKSAPGKTRPKSS